MSSCPAPDVRSVRGDIVLREIYEGGRWRMGFFQKVGWIKSTRTHHHPVIEPLELVASDELPSTEIAIETHLGRTWGYWEWEEVKKWNSKTLSLG